MRTSDLTKRRPEQASFACGRAAKAGHRAGGCPLRAQTCHTAKKGLVAIRRSALRAEHVPDELNAPTPLTHDLVSVNTHTLLGRQGD